ncbi:MAG: hypothetical protein KHY83_05700 [Coriobacteriia bacterium]|nr:hypothetical protein [Coriobacteriia bacterium]
MTAHVNVRDTEQDRELYRETLDHTTPASDLGKLNRQALGRIQTATNSAAASVATTRHALLSRRRLVALGAGAAVVAGVGLLGVGLPMLGRHESTGGADNGPTAPAWSDPLATAGIPPFGLAVAYASENQGAPNDLGTAFELSATDVGLIPMISQNTREMQLRLNLAIVGQNVRTVTYHIDDRPILPPAFDDPWAAQPLPAPAISFQEHARLADADAVGGRYFGGFTSYSPVFKDRQDSGGIDRAPKTDAFVASASDVVWVDQKTRRARSSGEADSVGDAVTGSGTYQLIIAETPAWFWESDPVLTLFRDYENLLSHVSLAQTKRAYPDIAAYSALEDMSDSELEAKRAELEGLIDKLRGVLDKLFRNAQDTRDWMRSCYVANLRAVAELLSDSTIRVVAQFEDGATSERAYRIDPIDNFDDVAGARFDGLYELADPAFVPFEEMEESMQSSRRDMQRKQEEHTGLRDPFGEWLVRRSTSSSNISASEFPYCGTIAGEPDPAVDDRRLRAALFTITDVTETAEA